MTSVKTVKGQVITGMTLHNVLSSNSRQRLNFRSCCNRFAFVNVSYVKKVFFSKLRSYIAESLNISYVDNFQPGIERHSLTFRVRRNVIIATKPMH